MNVYTINKKSNFQSDWSLVLGTVYACRRLVLIGVNRIGFISFIFFVSFFTLKDNFKGHVITDTLVFGFVTLGYIHT